jgi:hypothetical protein
LKITILSPEKKKIVDGDAVVFVIQVSGIDDWNSADTAKKLSQLIRRIKQACQS